MTTSRGPCPPALAAEVYALTLVRTHRRCRADSPHQQTIPDVVGEAFAQWLGSPADKTEHPAGEHAHFISRYALYLLTCRRSRRRVGPEHHLLHPHLIYFSIGGDRSLPSND